MIEGIDYVRVAYIVGWLRGLAWAMACAGVKLSDETAEAYDEMTEELAMLLGLEKGEKRHG